jgi:signal transduction histidine kinase
LNTPLGAARSSAQTLGILVERYGTASDEEKLHLAGLIHDVCRTIDESTVRQGAVIRRLQRFTNLDRAEERSVDLRRLVEDVVSMIGVPSTTAAHLEVDLPPLPRVTCRPQQLSAVFFGILQNAVDTVPTGGKVRVAASSQGSEAEIVIANDGPDIFADTSASALALGSRVSRDRVTAADWALFASRRIVQEHGGRIQVTRLGMGETAVVITLPARAPEESCAIAKT